MSTLGVMAIALIMLCVGFLIGLLVHKDNYIYCLEERDLYKSAFGEVFEMLPKEEQEKILRDAEKKERKLEERI